MEMEEDIEEEMLQAEVRALSEKPNPAAPVNLDEELMRLLKGPGYSLARRSLGIESSSLPDTSKHSAPSLDSGTRFLHSSGFSDVPVSARMSRVHAAILSLHASLQSAAAAAAADASSSETASLPGVSSSWSVSSASDAEVVAHDWVVDDKVADNVFRLKETLSSRMYMRAKKRSDGFPVLSGTGELKSGFGVVTDLGSIFVDAEQAQKRQSSGDDCSSAVSKGHELEGRVGEMTASIGGAFQGVFNKISGGVAAGDQFAQMLAADFIFFSSDCHSRAAAVDARSLLFPPILFHSLFPPAVAEGARLLSLPPLPTFPFPNFAGHCGAAPPDARHSNVLEATAAPVATCSFDRKQIEEVCGRFFFVC
jgi:hypothetical protein